MKTRRTQEGYFLVDHRAVGVLDTSLPVAPGAIFEAPTFTCSHCQRVVVMNPDRVRARAYCRKCDHHICDACEVARVASGGDCKPYRQFMDELQEEAEQRPPLVLAGS